MKPAVFLHTADWQLGKPFAGVESDEKRILLQSERIAAIHRMREAAAGADFVVVAGDLFDSVTPTKSTVSAACAAIGSLGVPVFSIPGNHDHGGAGSVWRQEFFLREQAQLAPNLRVLLEPSPVELLNAVLFPCPLLRRHETQNPLGWLQQIENLDARFGDKARIVLAHGSAIDFSSSDADDEEETSINYIDLTRLPEKDFDYVALGDWHGTKQINSRSWYPGTPEPDRFARGAGYETGNALRVQAERGLVPVVEKVVIKGIEWHEMEFDFEADEDLLRFVERVDAAIANQANRALFRLHLTGALGIDASAKLERHLDAWRSRLIRIKLNHQVAIAPTEAELVSLTARVSDPLISRVATRLSVLAQSPDPTLARIALRELYLACAAKA